jgi:hypothetical protein
VSTSRENRTTATGSAVLRRRESFLRWLAEEDRDRLLLLTLLTLLAAGLMVQFSGIFTASALMIPLLLSDMLLSPRRVPRFLAFLVTVLLVTTFLEFEVLTEGVSHVPARRWVALAIVLVSAAIVLAVASRRTRLGVGGLTVDAMLLDLQERISRQGTLPALPPGWYAELATRSAGGTSFAGDFVVAYRSPSGRDLSLVVVDVSGKGVVAGSRSLVLSGAFSALLGSTDPDSFLDAANAFVLRQDWSDEFATAVHLSVDLATGDYVVRSAGHPPAIVFRSGAGRWHVLDEARGPLLGVAPEPAFTSSRGRLDRQDALMLYTDGLVERRRRDIGLGIDRLVGEAERRLHAGFQGSARLLVDRLGGSSDDCALVVLERL